MCNEKMKQSLFHLHLCSSHNAVSGTKEKHLNLTLADEILIFFASVQLPPAS